MVTTPSQRTRRKMACRILVLFLSAALWQLAACDFARYADFVRQQAKNETTEKLAMAYLFLAKDWLNAEQQLSQAGTGIEANTVIGLLKQNRGLSWSIGGDGTVEDVVTLANMIKLYNPDVTGYSVGSGPVWKEMVSRLNIANPGARSERMPGQAELLVERMKSDSKIDMENDWKVITLFVGGNDLCDLCYDKERYPAENYRANVQEALDYLHAHVSKAFVNLVEILQITIVKQLGQIPICDALLSTLCPCVSGPLSDEDGQTAQSVVQRYRDVLNELIQSGRYDTKDDFTVVVQPFLSNSYPPAKHGSDYPDLSYFAPDCFHLSLKGHRLVAEGLWNNMLEPMGKKRTSYNPGDVIQCPTEEHPYFYTYRNSQQSKETSKKILKQTIGKSLHQKQEN